MFWLAMAPVMFLQAPAVIASDDGRPPAVARKKVDAALFISPDKMARAHGQGLTLVDIRAADDFARAHIPGSLNIPLHFIKAKRFLKPTHIVVVAEGYQYARLEDECRKLEGAGFTVSILLGGLNEWQRGKGPLQGEAWPHARFNSIAPAEFYPERSCDHWVVLDCTANQRAKEVIPSGVHITFGTLEQPASIPVEKIHDRPAGESSLCLILNEDGQGCEEIGLRARQAGLERIFYLEGGLRAYRLFLENVDLSHRPRKQRTQEIRQCPSCG